MGGTRTGTPPLWGTAATCFPYVVAFGLILGGRRSSGLGLAATLSWMSLPAWCGIMLLLALGTGGDGPAGDTYYVGEVLMFFPSVQLPLLVAAVAAHRRLPAGEKRTGAFGLACVIVLVYGMLLVAIGEGSSRRSTADREAPAVREEREKMAEVTQHLQTIYTCAALFSEKHRGAGYPTRLDLLGPGGEGCLEAELAGGEWDRYRFLYTAGVPDRAGRIVAYSLCARPIRKPGGGHWTQVIDESGHMPPAVYVDPSEQDLTSCGAAWTEAGGEEGMIRRIKHCVVGYAAINPEYGYPRSLEPVSFSGSGCLSPVSGSARDTVTTSTHTYRYEAGPAGDDGRVRSFRIHAGTNDGNGPSHTADETGIVQADNREGRRP